MILEQTANDNLGLCAPCFKGKNHSPSAHLWESNQPISQLDDIQKRRQLGVAIRECDLNRINGLLSMGSSFLELPPDKFHTWLGEAIASKCELTILEKLVSEGCDPNRQSDSPDKTTPLEIAVNNQRIDAIKFLLANGADPNIGRPMIAAVNYRIAEKIQIQMLTLLLDAGADINRSFELYGDDSDRFTVLDWGLLYKISTNTIRFKNMVLNNLLNFHRNVPHNNGDQPSGG